jgi:N-sulfoglucosamine sulfohydrolase
MDRQRAVSDARYKYIRSWYTDVPGGTDLKFRDNIDMVLEMRAMYDAGQLNAIQQQWYEPPGAERLFDLELDPFEIHDVSSDPQYQGVLQRMRGAMDAWPLAALYQTSQHQQLQCNRSQSGALWLGGERDCQWPLN